MALLPPYLFGGLSLLALLLLLSVQLSVIY